MRKETDMSKLFEPSEINAMTLENRFVRSAIWEIMAADDGSCKKVRPTLYP